MAHRNALPGTVFLSLLLVGAASAAMGEPVTQVTHGPRHHFFGYIGHVGNTPWNASGRHMVMLQTTFQDRMPEPGDAADIVLLDTGNGYAPRKVEETRAWNPQQGTMLYWNPDARETQFFFNDRDPDTQKVFCVLYDVEKGERVKEYRFDDTPIGNSGVAQGGGAFLGMNYGRLDRLRKVTGYPGAYDWTVGVNAPENDGVWKVNVASGDKTLLVSFARLANAIRPQRPDVDEVALFINHTLWSRDDQRILCYLRGGWKDARVPHVERVDAPFVMQADGSHVTFQKTFLGGHPEWGEGHHIIGTVDRKQVVYDADTEALVRELGDRKLFWDPEGDIALSPDGRLLVNGHRRRGENAYVVYNMETGAYATVSGFDIGEFHSGDVRLDPAPCWRRDSQAIAVPALAEDGTRQTFVIDVGALAFTAP